MSRPIGFHSAVPKGIDLAPLPETLSEMIPEERGYEAVIVEKRTLLVDPTSRVVIALMTVSSWLATRRASEEAHQIPCICCALVRSSMAFGPRVRLTVLVRKRGSERLPSIRAIPARVLTDRAATSPATRTTLPL